MPELHPHYLRVLRAVTDEPEQAKIIFRRWEGIEDWKALSRKLRARRSWLGEVLERLAEEGYIERTKNRDYTGLGVTFKLSLAGKAAMAAAQNSEEAKCPIT